MRKYSPAYISWQLHFLIASYGIAFHFHDIIRKIEKRVVPHSERQTSIIVSGGLLTRPWPESSRNRNASARLRLAYAGWFDVTIPLRPTRSLSRCRNHAQTKSSENEVSDYAIAAKKTRTGGVPQRTLRMPWRSWHEERGASPNAYCRACVGRPSRHGRDNQATAQSDQLDSVAPADVMD